MRRIIYFLAISLDGFLARSQGEIDWLFTDQDYGFSGFFEEVDTVLLGRKTYEQVLTFGEYPYSTKQNFIFSRAAARFAHGTTVNQPVGKFAAELKSKPGKDIWLVGGGELAGHFFAAGAVDALVVYVHPILIGRGLALASGLPGDVRLKLEESKSYDTGLVRLSYHVNL